MDPGEIKAAASIFDYAGEKCLQSRRKRETNPGYAFAPDSRWQSEFKIPFPFRETPDQMKAITFDTKMDMDNLTLARWTV